LESNILEWLAITIGLVVPTISILKFRAEKKKLTAERESLEACADKANVETNLLLVKSFQDLAKTITELYTELEEINERVNYLTEGIGKLVTQLETAGMTPVWKPEFGDRRKEITNE
jgi:hypothetical protein